jgi:hypothetical protein
LLAQNCLHPPALYFSIDLSKWFEERYASCKARLGKDVKNTRRRAYEFGSLRL